MLTLYYKPTCAFYRRVVAVIDRLELEVEMKDVTDPEVAGELEKEGGKLQTPYLSDSEKEVGLYESDDIVEFLQKNYGQASGQANKPRVHIGDNACASCEG